MKSGDPIPCPVCEGTGETFGKVYDGSPWRECESCDGYGVEVTPWSRRAYLALVKEADATGWPKDYREDLTVHDRRFCEELGPDASFVWVTRESGTFMMSVTEDPNVGTKETVYSTIMKCFGHPGDRERYRFYSWDGRRLREVADADTLARWAVDEARVLAHRRKRAA